MTSPRTFEADSEKDDRVPRLLTVIMSAIKLERAAKRKPIRLHFDSDTYVVLCKFMGVLTIDKLFGLLVHVNLSAGAPPFTIESET